MLICHKKKSEKSQEIEDTHNSKSRPVSRVHHGVLQIN